MRQRRERQKDKETGQRRRKRKNEREGLPFCFFLKKVICDDRGHWRRS